MMIILSSKLGQMSLQYSLIKLTTLNHYEVRRFAGVVLVRNFI